MGLKSWAKGLVVKAAVKKAEKEIPMLGKLWEFLNGKKRHVGAALTIVGLIATHAQVMGGPVAKYAGFALLGLGYVHAALKWLAANTDLDDDFDNYKPAAVVALCLLLGAGLVACGSGDTLLSPDPQATPTASPTPDPKCSPDAGLIQATKKGQPSVPIIAWSQGQEVRLTHRLFNATGEPIPASCGVTLRTDWKIQGSAYCQTYGSVETNEVRVICQGSGDAFVDAVRAGVEASAVFYVVPTDAEADAINRRAVIVVSPR